MIERVARAIYEGRNGAGCRAWGAQTISHQEPYLKDATVAIKALREPTAEVKLAAAAILADRQPDGAARSMSDIWYAIIDATLY